MTSSLVPGILVFRPGPVLPSQLETFWKRRISYHKPSYTEVRTRWYVQNCQHSRYSLLCSKYSAVDTSELLVTRLPQTVQDGLAPTIYPDIVWSLALFRMPPGDPAAGIGHQDHVT